jgi:hypothetical protein
LKAAARRFAPFAQGAKQMIASTGTISFYWLRMLFLLLAFGIPLTAEGDIAFTQEVCSFFSGYRATPNVPPLKQYNAERSLGEICVPKYAQVCGEPNIALARLYEMGLPTDDEVLERLINDNWVIRASEVDIDNDGQNEIRLYITAGTAHCTYSYFFKRTTTGKFQCLTHPSYDILREEGRFCAGNLAFIRYKGQVFTLEVYDKINTVWQGSHDELHEVCSFWEQPR